MVVTVNLHLWSATSHLTLGLRCMGSSTIFGLQLNLYPYKWGDDQYNSTHSLFNRVLVVIIFVAQEVACGYIKSCFTRKCSPQSCWIGAFLLMRVFKIMKTSEFLFAYNFWRNFHTTRATSLVVPLRGHQHCQMIQWRRGLRWQGWLDKFTAITWSLVWSIP